MKHVLLSTVSYGVLQWHFGPMPVRDRLRIVNQAMFELWA